MKAEIKWSVKDFAEGTELGVNGCYGGWCHAVRFTSEGPDKRDALIGEGKAILVEWFREKLPDDGALHDDGMVPLLHKFDLIPRSRLPVNPLDRLNYSRSLSQYAREVLREAEEVAAIVKQEALHGEP